MKNFTLIVLFLSLISVQFAYSQPEIQAGERDWTIVATYTIPGKASGLAWDGQYLYTGTVFSGDDNIIYKIDPSDGSYSTQCVAPIDGAYGLTYDETTGNLWTTNHPGAYDPALAIQFDMSGNFVSQFELPATYFSGIAWDNDDFWANCYYNPDGEVYKVDASGNILTQFASPGEQPWDICIQDEYLWVVDYNGNSIDMLDQSGNIQETHAPEGTKPSGIVYDGTYLWYCDGAIGVNSTLYKINLGGAGTPEINVPVTDHNYGTVEIDATAVWNCYIENTGTAELEVTYGNISGQNSEYINWPEGNSFTIAAGGNTTISIEYNPQVAGPLDASAVLESNDPVTPQVNLHMTGTAVYSQPYLVLIEDDHDYGDVRVNANTRWYMHLQNYGNEPLTITDISFDLPQYYLDDGIQLPFDLVPLATLQIGVWFSPDGDTDFEGTATVITNDAYGNPNEVSLHGSGLLKEWPMGDVFWSYQLPIAPDNSIKAISGVNDTTNDGIDNVIVCSEDYYIRCFNGNSHGTADVLWTYMIYPGPVFSQNGLAVADITGDGQDEVIVGTTGGYRAVFSIDGKLGLLRWSYNTNEYGDGGWVYQVDASFDYNDDDVTDVLAATGDDSYDTGPKRVFCLDGRTGNVIWEKFLGGPVFAVIGVHDFNGDGYPDVVAGSSNESETQGIITGLDGTNGQILWSRTTTGTSVWALAELDDINDNGSREIVAGDFGGRIYLIDPATEELLGQSSIGNVIVLRMERMDDVNGDGFADVLVAHSGTHAYVLDGTTTNPVVDVPLADKCWNVARIEDVSGDGVNDFTAGTLFTSNYAYFMDGTTGDNLFSQNFMEAIDGLNTIADINGDGSMEMVVGGRYGKLMCYSGGLDAVVGEKENIATENSLKHYAYPNPFRGQTTISFELKQNEQVNIDVYDQTGRKVVHLLDRMLEKGTHQVIWDTDKTGDTKASVYYYVISTSGTNYTGKLVRLK